MVVIGDHHLRLTFEDGIVGDVTFDASEWHGVAEPLADQSFFAQVRVDPELGTVTWPNRYDMTSEPLYEEACRHQVHDSSRLLT